MKEQIKKLVVLWTEWTILSVILTALFPLQMFAAAGLYGFGCLMLPVICYSEFRGKQAERDFYDMTGYMEQLLCSYQRENTLLQSFEDCKLLYSYDSRMGKVLQKVIENMQSGTADEEETIVTAAFRRIDSLYPAKRLKRLHSFLEKVSQMGGEYQASLDILLRDLQLWKQRIILYQKRKHTIAQESKVTIFFVVFLCYLSGKIMPGESMARIVQTTWYSCSVLITGIFLLLGEVCLSWYLSKNWMEFDMKKYRKKENENYEYVRSHSKGIQYHWTRKVCRQQIEQEFPYWILTVTLYLQEDSVYQSICHSMEEEDGILKKEIKNLLQRIYESPDSIQAYLQFCDFAEIPELQTIMKLLYAIHTNGVQDTTKQILFLVEQNCEIVRQTEETALARNIAVFELLKQFPMVIGGIKIVFDLFLFLMLSMGSRQIWM